MRIPDARPYLSKGEGFTGEVIVLRDHFNYTGEGAWIDVPASLKKRNAQRGTLVI